MAPIDVAKLVEALGTLAWPTIACIVLWRLFPAIRAIIESRSFKVKISDMEITVQEASDQLRKQIEDLQEQVGALRKQATVPAPGPAKPVPEPIPASKRILWVDDNPGNNALIIAKLREDACDVRLATSTAQGLGILGAAKAPFDAIISDMGRVEREHHEREAGLTFLRAVRKMGLRTPVVIYSNGANAAFYRDEVIAAGGTAATGSPVELLEFLKDIFRAKA